jgi:hypothetical protein
MEFRRRPYIHPFWNRPLCDRCRFHAPQYQFITTTTAKKEPYFLDEDDLISLKEFSQKSTRYHNAAHTRWFSRVSVEQKAIQKLRRTKSNLEDRIKKRDVRSNNAKKRLANIRYARRRHIVERLTAIGFPNASKHYCFFIDSFVRNTKNHLTNKRWTAKDVIPRCIEEKHYMAAAANE